MEAIKFNVKEESLQEFADKYVIEMADLLADRRPGYKIEPYSLLGKDFYVRKSILELAASDSVIQIEMSDTSRRGGSDLKNIYQYSIDEHDSISFKMTLIDFNIVLVKKEK